MNDSIQAFIGLGCNLGDRAANLASAIQALEAHERLESVIRSSLYETDPMGPADQPDYINAVASLRTRLEPEDLLDVLQNIENDHGRVRDGKRWGPRTLDLDLLLYGDKLVSTQRLTVPHPGIAERSFVLLPLYELQADLIIPEKGSVKDLMLQCRQFGIRRLDS